MRNLLAVLRWLLIGLMHLLFYVLGIFIVPYIYHGRVWNVQLGEGSNRYIYKQRFSKIN